MTDQRCSYCFGNGWYASPLTNWDAVPCHRCEGTGVAHNDLVRAGEEASRKLLAQLDDYVDGRTDYVPGAALR